MSETYSQSLCHFTCQGTLGDRISLSQRRIAPKPQSSCSLTGQPPIQCNADPTADPSSSEGSVVKRPILLRPRTLFLVLPLKCLLRCWGRRLRWPCHQEKRNWQPLVSLSKTRRHKTLTFLPHISLQLTPASKLGWAQPRWWLLIPFKLRIIRKRWGLRLAAKKPQGCLGSLGRGNRGRGVGRIDYGSHTRRKSTFSPQAYRAYSSATGLNHAGAGDSF